MKLTRRQYIESITMCYLAADGGSAEEEGLYQALMAVCGGDGKAAAAVERYLAAHGTVEGPDAD